MKKTADSRLKTAPRPTVRPRAAVRRARRVQAIDPGDNGAARHQHIAEAAYFLFLERGAQPGFDLDDWLAAERRVLAGR